MALTPSQASVCNCWTTLYAIMYAKQVFHNCFWERVFPNMENVYSFVIVSASQVCVLLCMREKCVSVCYMGVWQWLLQAQLAQTGYITRSMASAWLPGWLAVDLTLANTNADMHTRMHAGMYTPHPLQMVLVLPHGPVADGDMHASFLMN